MFSRVKQKQQQDNQIKTIMSIKLIIEMESNETNLGTGYNPLPKHTTQLIQQVDIEQCFDENNCIKLKKLLILLKNQYNFPLQNKQIYFKLQNVELFMNCGVDPITDNIKIAPEEYKDNQCLTIKAKDLGISIIHRLMSFQNITNNQQNKNQQQQPQNGGSKCRRTKQRRIGHIIDKVIEWRRYYNGTIDDKNQTIKYSLEDAAKQVNISKKSLDDYLFQIRFGHRYNFNFNEHYNDKVGVLRDFVRQRKKNDKTQNKVRKNNQKGVNRHIDESV